MSSDGQAEFLIFAQVGAALGALCLLPAIVGRLVRLARGEGRHTYTDPAGIGQLDFPASPYKVHAAERIRVRNLEREAIRSRKASRRASAVRELRKIGHEESVTTMLVASHDPNHKVRTEAAEGLAALDPEMVDLHANAVAARSRRAEV